MINNDHFCCALSDEFAFLLSALELILLQMEHFYLIKTESLKRVHTFTLILRFVTKPQSLGGS